MIVYIIITAILGIVFGLLLAIRTKKAENLTYGKLDKAGRITNILLLITYTYLAPAYMVVGFLSYPAYEGFLGFIGWILAIICSSTSWFCFPGLGASVALRKKGFSKLSCGVQFAGLASIALTFLLYAVLAGNLFVSLN